MPHRLLYKILGMQAKYDEAGNQESNASARLRLKAWQKPV
jgi:hypothetical protein